MGWGCFPAALRTSRMTGDEPLPLAVADMPLAPRKKPARKPGKPAWTDYQVKTPVRCDHCVTAAYESLRDNEPFLGIAHAHRKRKHGADVLLLCWPHARAVEAQDAIDYRSVRNEAAPVGGRVMS